MSKLSKKELKTTYKDYVFDIKNKEVIINNPELASISYRNDPINTVKGLLMEYGYSKNMKKDFAIKDDLVKVLSQDDKLVLTKVMYDYLKDHYRHPQNLIPISIKNDVIQTMLVTQEDCIKYIHLVDSKDFEKSLIKHKNNPLLVQLAFNKVVNSSKEGLREILKLDSSLAVKIISQIDFKDLDVEKKIMIKDELNRIDWFPNPSEHNELAQYMFIDCFRRNPNKAMKAFDNKLNFFFHEQYYKNEVEMENILSSLLSSKECECNNTFMEFISLEPNILIRALETNYENTINNLINYVDGKSISRLHKLDVMNRDKKEKILNILREHNFSIKDGKNYLLQYIDSSFFVQSLENDYEGTKETMKQPKVRATPVRFTDAECEKVLETIRERGGEIDIPSYIEKYPSLLTGIMNTNIDDAIYLLDHMQEPLSKEVGSPFLHTLLEHIDFKEHPNCAVMLSYAIFTSNSADFSLERMAKKGMPVGLLPIEKIEDMKPFLKDKEEEDLYNKIYFNSKNYEYSPQDEEALLKKMGSTFDNLEDEIALIAMKRKTRKDLTPMQLLALALLIKKDHHKKGIKGCQVDIFGYHLDKYEKGCYNRASHTVKIRNGHNNSMIDILRTIFHEDNHAEQFQNMRTCNVASDDNIIAYAKDDILVNYLQATYNFDFYAKNYLYESKEFDTDIKANMEVIQILRLDEKIAGFEQLPMEEKIKKFIDTSSSASQYDLDGVRNAGNEGTLISLFDEHIQDMFDKGFLTKEKVLKQYPIIAYEYNLDENPIRKLSEEELMEKYINATKIDKDIYFSIMKHRMDPVYNKDYRRYVDKTIDMMEAYNYKDDRLISLVLDSETLITKMTNRVKEQIDVHKITIDKYMRLAQELIERERKNSKEEFYSKISR